MLTLFKCEWQKLYSKKSTVSCFLLIPFILIASGRYCSKVNLLVDPNSPQFTQFYNFPIAALQKQLMFTINIIVVLFIVLSVTEEYANGSIRMVLIRPITKIHLFGAKFLVIISTMFLFLITYLLFAYIIGFFMFSKSPCIKAFFWNDSFNPLQMFIYTLKYYLISFFTLVAMSSVAFFVATISKSVTVGMGINIGIILFSLMYPTIVEILVNEQNTIMYELQLLSIVQIQYQGIAVMLSQSSDQVVYILRILAAYTVLFLTLSYYIYNKNDILV